MSFPSDFECLTGHLPFPWQEALFSEQFLEKRFPKTCDIPTGLGKTSTIAIWLLALAHHVRMALAAEFPRRLVYVVNRRTVVDQATRDADRIRKALATKPELKVMCDALRSLAARPSDYPLAISTLRGAFADNAEWRDDPARPAVIVGTVDMIGSRLLFAGYGRGFKSRPLHAGFLGQDTLLIHDEAHLEPAFQQLIAAIELEQRRCCEFGRFRVMALTATSRGGGDEQCGLTDADRKHTEVRKRIEAKKGIAFCSVDETETADEVTRRALKHKDSRQAILIFLRKLDDVKKVADKLRKAGLPVQTLTGTLRGLERDALAKTDRVFARFMPEPEPEVTPEHGTVFLVCTSAGEVGINISADHLVCDLTPFDSMAQRFGRVNRFGDGDARIDVVHHDLGEAAKATGIDSPEADNAEAEADSNSSGEGAGDTQPSKKTKLQSPFARACARTLSLLQRLPRREDHRHSASPVALGELPLTDRQAAFTPQPVILPASDILFDAWALTSVREKLPGRPPVADWLHGVAEWEPPETHVAWREEVGCITGELLERHKPGDLLEDYPLKPHELLRDQTSRIFDQLETMAGRCPELSAWLIESDGEVRALALLKLVERNRVKKPVVNLAECTVLLPPIVGGLENGMLNGSAAFDEARRDSYDVSDKWKDENEVPRRCRVWDGDPPQGMRLVRTLDVQPDAGEADEDDEPPHRRYWHWCVRPRSADDDGSRMARQKQDLVPHLQSAADFARLLVAKLGLSDPEASAVTLASWWHDLGKNRAVWQRSIGNGEYPRQVLAKSGGKMRSIDLTNYRHEFGSLIDVSSLPQFIELKPEVQDLVLHLIAAHHGRARPHFPLGEAFDLERSEEAAASVAREVPRRFARLQRKYGRWGLAYIESLVRAADALASQANEASGAAPVSPAGISTQQAAR
jgi:CRISPR-associated endonuclease/helicase Cas3